jgi:PAS domain S-box-containing protein
MSGPELGRILIVDDEIELMTILCQLLQKQGYETQGFTSAAEALSALREREFDLLVSDLMMPEMDGITLLQRATEIDPQLIGIIMTGQATVQTAVEAMKVGAFDYLLKPFKLNVLLPILSRAMEVRRLRRENVQLHETVAINELCRAMSLTLDRETLLGKAVQGALHQCRADEASILLPTANGEELCIAAVGGGHSRDILGSCVPADQHIAGWVWRHKEPMVLHGKVQDLSSMPLKPREDIQSAISMPMMSGGKPIGILNVNVTRARAPFTPGQVEALSILASAAAAALENSTLYRQVKESEEKFRSIVETSEEWIWSVDKDLRITYTNPVIERILGYSPQDLLGQPGMSYVHPDDRQLAEACVAKGISDKSGWNGIVSRWRHKDGSYRHLESNARPMFNPAGDFMGFRGADRDITGRKELEDQLRQAQKMEAVGRLAGGVAHDFNNLLTIIMGHTELMQAENPKGLTGESLDEIKSAATRAVSLTRQLLTFSRKELVQPRVLDLNVVVTDVSKMLKRLIGEDIDLKTVLNPEAGEVKADPGHLEQVIINLVVNARDAMPQGGCITIESDSVELSEVYFGPDLKPGPHVMLAVSDNGCGMDAEVQAHIFEPFFTTKEEGKGTGLGLFTVYGIVRQNDGHISVHSEPGQGTTFKIFLPRLEPQDRSLKEKNLNAPVSTGSETILLLEDVDQLRHLARVMLQSRGYHVLEARDGAEALRVSENYESPIHLLVTDVVMPNMSGPEVSKRLLTRRPEMKVLFMSGYTDDAIARHGVLKATTVFLQKPFTGASLAQKVREALDSHR